MNSLDVKGIKWSLLEGRKGMADISLPNIYFSPFLLSLQGPPGRSPASDSPEEDPLLQGEE